MFRSLRTFFLIGSAALAWNSTALADFYVYPKVGAFIPLDGDRAYSLGVTAGYDWTGKFATEMSYARIIGTGNALDGDLIDGSLVYRWPLPFVTPFASLGGGLYHSSFQGDDSTNPFAMAGGGISIGPLLFLNLTGGVNYGLVFDATDFIEPYVAIGISF